ncbi:16S rRNA (adenine(1518)-N(6)/adenine(1519)-N(6))-dimethyltransferase [Candidatus Cytomitobacter indipagum]|uniref:16S rRNA (Adenine(1518)-N(6)/adenine(1519)-N(6))-dimethyltransferase n=1 Tax=Candidatus Cytomitobacter indipagum TaxID=2601575 RepID=A0A5C0UE06_9PROT|nr:rRNA adenine dimethyltransferase family protein [Candidatus Cytomitobacter indipagum]QEK37999.1 16S rRNA (adenine(1518)-N(6)/adenine(1519)-N(6))-dimethyltransferase [Candidatus Cytomitobacter indipagum]
MISKRSGAFSSQKIHTKKNLGQHYLVDVKKLSFMENFISNINNHVIEVGPGTGQLTKYIIKNCAKLLAIEKDIRFISHLNNLFAKEKFHNNAENNCINYDSEDGKNDSENFKDARKLTENAKEDIELFKSSEEKFKVINCDILEIDFNSLPDYILVGNLPYNISALIIAKFIRCINKFKHGVFLIQKEVADKICAKCCDRDYGRISAFVQSVAKAKKILNVPPGCFAPPPKVNSEVIHLEILDDFAESDLMNLDNLDTILRAAFSSPRKTIQNNLSSAFPHLVEKFSDIIIQNNLNMKMRPNQVSVSVYQKMANIFKEEENDKK